MIGNLDYLVEDAVKMICECIIVLFFDSRISLMSAFVFLMPFWSSVLIVHLLGRITPQTKTNLRMLNDFQVVGLTINVLFNTYYFSTKGIITMHGRMHMVAALCCLLFIIFLAFSYKPSADVQNGIMISYMGISLSLFTLPLEYFPLENKVLYTFYLLGVIIYFFGLVIIAISARFAGFARKWFRG